jgi:hypothetical protein
MFEAGNNCTFDFPSLRLLDQLGITVSELLDLAHASSSDDILIAGSLVEGIGTPFSDVDIYVIGEEKPSLARPEARRHHYVNAHKPSYEPLPRVEVYDGELHETFEYLRENTVACNVEYWTHNEVRALVDEVRGSYQFSLTNSANLGQSSYAKGMFVHRLLNCVPYRMSDQLKSLIGALDLDEVCYVGYRKFAASYDEFRDVVGAWRAGDLESALVALKTHLTDQMMALSFLLGHTNPNRKWVFQKIKRFPTELDSLADQYRAFMGLCAISSKEKVSAVEIGCDLLDLAFSACQVRLECKPKFLSTQKSLDLTRAEFAYRSARGLSQSDQLRLHYLYREKLFHSDGPSCRSLIGKCGSPSAIGV